MHDPPTICTLVTVISPWFFQNYALYPHMTVGENIAYPLRIARSDKATFTKAVAEVAELLELSAFLDRKPADLSGGQRQRMAMGRAIIRRPAVFLMDELLSNQDARLRQLMRIEIRDLQKRLGITMIYVTHDQVEAMTMADRIVVFTTVAFSRSVRLTKFTHTSQSVRGRVHRRAADQFRGGSSIGFNPRWNRQS